MTPFRALALSPAIGSAAAILAGPAAAVPSEVMIDVTVEEIAVLSISNATGAVTLDSPDREGFPADPASLAQLTLQTNFCIDDLQVDFPRVTGLRGGYPTRWYGAATGNTNTNTLGVSPYIITPGTGSFFGGTMDAFFGLSSDPVQGGSLDAPLTISGPSSGLCSPANGTFDLSLGVITKWDLTLAPEPLYAAPDIYTIPLTVSIIP